MAIACLTEIHPFSSAVRAEARRPGLPGGRTAARTDPSQEWRFGAQPLPCQADRRWENEMSKREDDWDDDWVDDEEEWAARITTMAEHILAERGIVADYDELARLVDEALDEPDLEGEAMTELLVDSEGVYDL